MKKTYNLKVKLETGAEFLVKADSDCVGEICAWLAGIESVSEYGIVGASKAPHTKRETGIASARLEKGWTQQQLADAIGVAQQHIQRWESGVYTPKTATLMRIGEALGVDWSTLV